MRWSALMFLAGCKFSANVAGDGSVVADDGRLLDAAIDAPEPDAFDDACFGAGTFHFCLAAAPTGSHAIESSIDTSECDDDRQAKIMLGATQVCAVSAGTITLPSGRDVEVTGQLPLVLVATTSITIAGRVDASSFDDKLGPAANAAPCNNTGIDGTAAIGSGGGGGAGGTFGSIGGNGGMGGVGAGGVATAVPATSPLLRGGCPGGTGMPGTAGRTGAGGNGGGAMLLATHGTISITGTIDVSGGGANGGRAARGGGGGGGSGGMLVLHALQAITIDSAARISANGGGGGGGAGSSDDGADGFDPTSDAPLSPAFGGQTATAGRTKGGNGAAGSTAATVGEPGSSGGGGGGGGGVGLIRVLTPGVTFPAGTVSPPPTN